MKDKFSSDSRKKFFFAYHNSKMMQKSIYKIELCLLKLQKLINQSTRYKNIELYK